jgi:integrase
MRLGEIRPRHVAAWVAEQRDGASTISRDLAILHAGFDSAEREELIQSNPARRIERPKMPQRRWRLLQPNEVPAVSKAFSDDRARKVFLTAMLTGLRRCELKALRWEHVDLLEGTLRVVESKSEQGERLVAVPPTLAAVPANLYAGSRYRADSNYVFGHPERGTPLETSKWYPEQFRAALAAAGITDYIRPFHDARHAALTNLAATGASPIAVMATPGHRSMSTTRRYLHLAGIAFRDEANALERRLLGGLQLDHEREDPLLVCDLVNEPGRVADRHAPHRRRSPWQLGRSRAWGTRRRTVRGSRGRDSGCGGSRFPRGAESSTHLSGREPTAANQTAWTQAVAEAAD